MSCLHLAKALPDDRVLPFPCMLQEKRFDNILAKPVLSHKKMIRWVIRWKDDGVQPPLFSRLSGWASRFDPPTLHHIAKEMPERHLFCYVQSKWCGFVETCPDDLQAKALAEAWKFLYAVRLRLASRKAPTEQVRTSRSKPLIFQRFLSFWSGWIWLSA